MENLAVTAILHNTSNSNREITQYQERKEQYFNFFYTLRARVSANLTVTAKVTENLVRTAKVVANLHSNSIFTR